MQSSTSVSTGTLNSQAVETASSRYFAAERTKPAPINACSRSVSRLQVVNLRPSVSCESFLPVSIHSVVSPLPPLTTRQSSNTLRLSPGVLRKSWAPGSYSDDHIRLSDTRTAAVLAGSSPAERVAFVMACTDYPPEVLTKVDAYKQKLNTSSGEWKTLAQEDDVYVLSALMWDWIDELKVSTTSPI